MANENMPQEVASIWTAMGLSPQVFPIYYSMGPVPFTNAAGAPSGAAGSVARLTKDLSNWPHMFMGVRIDNTYELPTAADADGVARYRACKEYVDSEQTVTINLAQQNITANQILQSQLCGRIGSGDWHPFPAPFPMAGANNILVELQRVTSYPQIVEGVDVTPVVRCTILAAVFRADLQTTAVHRRLPRGG